ncbi:hypothetical protein Tco_0345198 [Tanacetum coccineum]
MAQQVIPPAQLVPRFHKIRRCNNYAVLQSIPCSHECKIVGQILLDHPLSYDLTATADVPVVYLQQFWRTVSKVPGPEDTIKFMLNTQEFIYRVDMVGYQGVVDKVSAFYTKNLAQPWQTMVKVFNRCLTTRTSGHDRTTINIFQLFHAVINRTNVDYVALLWWDFMNNVKQKKEAIHVYTTRDVRIRGMLISDAFPTEEIRTTNDFKESTPRAHRTPTLTASPQGKKRKQNARELSSPRKTHKITIKRKQQSTTSIPPPGDDRERDAIAEATLPSLALHKTALAAEAQENVAKVQEKLYEEETEKMIEGDEDEESYASEFADSILNDDVDDFGTRLEPKSYKENPEKVDNDDVEIEKETKDDENVEKDNKAEEIKKDKNDVEKTDEVVKEKDIVDDMTGSMENRKELKRTPIPSPTRSPRNVSSSDKTVFKELTATVSPTTATTSKIREVLDHCNKVDPDITFAKTKEMITQEMPRLVNLAVNKDREVDLINAKEMITKEFATHGPKMIEELFRKHMQNTTLNLYPTTSSSAARKSSADLQHQLYLNMKSNPQDQAADPELWEILKAKFDKQ